MDAPTPGSFASDRYLSKPEHLDFHGRHPERHRRKKIRAIILAAGLVVVILAVVLPVYFVVVRNRGQDDGGSHSNPGSPTGATTGGDGSRIVTDNGTEFVYSNQFGGFWVQDPRDPYTERAQPNNWTPPLNTSWNWATDKIYGVNLGGLFVLEPFISPELFQRYPTATDEYSLSEAMRADPDNGGINQIEEHYKTFITEQDIAEIAGAGLNFLRIPIPFWAIETWEGEPYLAKVSWTYFLRVLGWARKYGLRVCLDLHAVPGSQNGYNHSGRLSPVNFLAGNMGIANAERTLYYIRVITEFISQPEYRNLIPIFGIINEALVGQIGMDAMTSFYLKAHDMIRDITGYGEDNGPYIAIHDGFQGLTIWKGFLAGSDRVMMDQHPYFAFGGEQLDPIDVDGPDGQPGGIWPRQACAAWGPASNDSQRDFGFTFSGEFSSSPNDCGLFLRGVGTNSTNPQCSKYNDWENYSDTMKQGLQNFFLASLDAFQHWFYWTWKIGPSNTGVIGAPLWSYQLGLRNGWIPKDPRSFVGKCASLDVKGTPFDGSYSGWQTGATPTSTSIAASSSTQFPWPPPAISGAGVPISLLPTYTNTAPIITLPPETISGAPSQRTAGVDGWFDDDDKEGGITAVVGCTYPDEYNGIFSTIPTAPCTG